MFTKKILILSLTTLATFATIGATAGCSADLSDDMAGPAPTPAATTHVGPLKETARDVAPGGSASQDGQPSGKQADKATQVHMSIVNSTSQVLNLTSATSSGKGNHWQDRPTTLQPGQQQMVSNYAAGDAEINLTYTGAGDGVVFTLHGETPLTGSNQASGSTTSTSYTVNAQAASGYNPTFNYYMQPGHTFSYTGQADTFTVPAGVNSLKVTAVGGTGGTQGSDYAGAPGAQISGTLAVTPGEVLTLGVGGTGGGAVQTSSAGGWGLSAGGSSFSGGNGITGQNFSTGGGGGGTVVQDPSGKPLVVAGGGGGRGGVTGSDNGFAGGQGGAGGSLTGGNGQPGVNAGGKPGANTVSQGQDSQGGGEGDGGAGGGGLNGGMAGISGTGGGGGAGSSSDAGLTSPTIGVGPTSGGKNYQVGSITFAPAN